MRTIVLIVIFSFADSIVQGSVLRCVIADSIARSELSVPDVRGEVFIFDVSTGIYTGFFLETGPYDLAKYLDITFRKFEFSVVNEKPMSRTYVSQADKIGGITVLILNTYLNEFVLWIGFAQPSPGGISFSGECIER